MFGSHKFSTGLKHNYARFTAFLLALLSFVTLAASPSTTSPSMITLTVTLFAPFRARVFLAGRTTSGGATLGVDEVSCWAGKGGGVRGREVVGLGSRGCGGDASSGLSTAIMGKG